MTNKNYQLGCIPDPKDKRDLALSDYLIPQKLPLVIDWRVLTIPVKDQKNTPSCVGFSCVAMKEIQEKLEHNIVYNFDGLTLYKRCKKIDKYSGGGTYIRIAMKILQNEGIPNPTRKMYKIQSYAKLNIIEEMKTALVATGPFVGGVDVYENFKIPKNGVIPIPTGKNLGGHAILITGYNQNLRLFRFKNSWGHDWGQEGYAWLTYEFIEKHCHTAWAGVDLKDKVVQTFINTKKLKSAVKEAKLL